jgi:hypothetical protein
MPRKKEIKNLSVQELIEEKQKAIAVLSELKQWAISTIKDIESISYQLGLRPMDSNPVVNSSLSITNPSLAPLPNNSDLHDYSPINITTESVQIKQISIEDSL